MARDWSETLLMYDGLKCFDVFCELKKGIISVTIICIAHPNDRNMGRICCYLATKGPKDASYEWCQERAKEAKNGK